MGERQRRESVDRRSFLRLATLGSSAAAVALVVDGETAAEAAEATQTGSGYAESPHIRAYYDSARM